MKTFDHKEYFHNALDRAMEEAKEGQSILGSFANVIFKEASDGLFYRQVHLNLVAYLADTPHGDKCACLECDTKREVLKIINDYEEQPWLI